MIILDSWENPCEPDLPVPVMNWLKSQKGNGTIACQEKVQTAEAIVGRAGHRKMRMMKAKLPEPQYSEFYPQQRRSGGCNVVPCQYRDVIRSGLKKMARLSPILANINLHELDQFLIQKKSQFNKGERRAENPQYRRLTQCIYQRRHRAEKLLSEGREGDAQVILTSVRCLEEERSVMPSKYSMDPGYKRLMFCRYADDFLIGVIGSRDDAREIMREVTAFLSESLHLEASQ